MNVLPSWPNSVEKPLKSVPKSDPDETVSTHAESWSPILNWGNKQPEKATTSVTKEGDAAESNVQKLVKLDSSLPKSAEKPLESVPKSGLGETLWNNAGSLIKRFNTPSEKATTSMTKEENDKKIAFENYFQSLATSLKKPLESVSTSGRGETPPNPVERLFTWFKKSPEKTTTAVTKDDIDPKTLVSESQRIPSANLAEMKPNPETLVSESQRIPSANLAEKKPNAVEHD
ncbi:uncharacterized protein PHALS_00108 [Plasmopara halstedii]|uniref:Uncharacterized protein n=1 Tax=Plasmopara halstedii TaxID=4781 RepID=A0A0P1A6H5_PLAHL|nr:uncharacterized protein PHALS_00108 [Plasmopara halstedii]CEG35775.1 hypothetical protein PHALS_00108 [Plasmopara halstedii]|eukprot:XP_024572144.1 hypothetical protein PHALS_00108 [Plasmopara halstedii]